jgi:putative ABC transport system permease protein
VIGWPAAYLLARSWLDRFAYRIDLDATPFAIAGAAALGIALVSVSAQAIRAARVNPVEALRVE